MRHFTITGTPADYLTVTTGSNGETVYQAKAEAFRGLVDRYFEASKDWTRDEKIDSIIPAAERFMRWEPASACRVFYDALPVALQQKLEETRQRENAQHRPTSERDKTPSESGTVPLLVGFIVVAAILSLLAIGIIVAN